MNIYFSCSITGGRSEEETYQVIVREMLKSGHEVPTAHLSSPDVVEEEKVIDPVEVFNRDMNWLRKYDAVVAEVSSPSHGVGYEVAYALSLQKPVLCCYKRGKKVSKIITGNTSPNLIVKEYTNDAEAIQVVGEFLNQLNGTQSEY